MLENQLRYFNRFRELLAQAVKLSAADPKSKSQQQDYVKLHDDFFRVLLDFETENMKLSPAWKVDPDPTNSPTSQKSKP